MIGGIYGAIGAGAVAIGLLGSAYLMGDSAGANRVIARDARQQLADLKSAQDGRIAAEHRIGALEAQAGQREQARQETVREVYRDIPRIVDRPVYRNVCVDPDGVRLLDRAAAAAGGGDGADPAAPAGQAAGGAARPSPG